MATAPGNSQPDKMSADYVAKKIAEAQAQGKDVTTAKVQQVGKMPRLKNGTGAARRRDTSTPRCVISSDYAKRYGENAKAEEIGASSDAGAN